MTKKKLTIIAYSDPGFLRQAGEYPLQINPESYRQTHSTQYTDNDSTDTAGSPPSSTCPTRRRSSGFYLDATGVMETAIASVAAEIVKLKGIAYDYNGQIHAPNYLELVWGNGVTFNLPLTSLDIGLHPVSRADGTPLRREDQRRLRGVPVRRRKSPSAPTRVRPTDPCAHRAQRRHAAGHVQSDLRRQQILPGVAAHNRLANFRQLVPGSTLYFPPLARA